jgi:hypothetical protein
MHYFTLAFGPLSRRYMDALRDGGWISRTVDILMEQGPTSHEFLLGGMVVLYGGGLLASLDMVPRFISV